MMNTTCRCNSLWLSNKVRLCYFTFGTPRYKFLFCLSLMSFAPNNLPNEQKLGL